MRADSGARDPPGGWHRFLGCNDRTLTVLPDHFDSKTTVSYTHLDVYKRQEQGQSVRNIGKERYPQLLTKAIQSLYVENKILIQTEQHLVWA